MTRRKIIAFLASACIAMGIVLLVTMKANAEEIMLPNGDRENAVCTTFWSEPVYRVCQSKHMICEEYPETGQWNCWLRPIKW